MLEGSPGRFNLTVVDVSRLHQGTCDGISSLLDDYVGYARSEFIIMESTIGDVSRGEKGTSIQVDTVEIQVKWRDKSFLFRFELSAPLLELKMLIEGLTNVSPTGQKLIGLSKKIGLKLSDEASLESHQPAIKNGVIKITLIGTPDVEIVKFQEKVMEASTVFNDFSSGYSPATKEWQQLLEFSQKTTINFINEPRAGKKLLVLDLDHTLLDFSSKEDIDPLEMKRPYMDYFLSELYPYYDIAIWSQTSWRWLELKVTELGMMTSESYKICFVLDKSNMFKLDSGYVKPLHLIWSKHPHWGKQNTVIVDDLERNFVLNPESGVLISAFYRHPPSPKKAHRSKSSSSSSSSTSSDSIAASTSSFLPLGGYSSHPSDMSNGSLEGQDRNQVQGPGQGAPQGEGASNSDDPRNDQELLLLSRYLVRVSHLPDISSTDHNNWRKKC